MRRALALAKRGGRAVRPNPMVGCVLVKGGRVIAEGWHRRFGGPHAEPMALGQAGKSARGCDAYLTLEPCCYHGKTPPCTRALVEAGVKRVFAAMRDPNPKVSGKGLRALRRAGVRVESGLLEREARELNRPFITLMTKKRPHVVLKAAASLDGRIETSAGQSKWISSPETRRYSRKLRSEMDAILVGSGTALADDPRLTAGPKGPHPVRVVLDSRLRTPARAKVFNGPGKALVFTASRRAGAIAGAELIRVPKRGARLDLRRVLRALAERGVSRLLVEGGSGIHTSFLEAGLVDEVHLYLSPLLIGGSKAKSFFEGSGFRSLRKAPKLAGTRLRRLGPDIFLSGLIRS